MLKFLRLRYFWNESSLLEKEFSLSNPKFLHSVEFNVALTALVTTELTREEISQRLQKVLNFLGKKSFLSKSLIPQWNNNILITATLTSGPIGRHKAYSGWVRNSSSVGSKRQVKSSSPEPLTEEFSEHEFDEFEFLLKAITVDSIETQMGSIRLS
jgi:hypothetical protein